jgi:creatinine amidohydrolase
MKPRIEKMSWKEIQEAINPETVCIVPNGSTEQHGPHLKVDTDTNNAYEVALRAAAMLENTLVTPPIPFGCSGNHMNFPGTISLKLNTLKEVTKDIVHSLVHHGIRKIIFMVGHGGNIAATNAAAEELRAELKGIVIGVVYIAALVHEGYKCLESDIVWHADEWETSFSLYLNPEEVDMEKALDEIPHSPSALYVFHEDELSKSPVSWGLPMTDECTESGIFGYAKMATAEKGRIIAEEMIANLSKVARQLELIKV